MKRIVILGAGTAGTIMANRLSKRFAGRHGEHEVRITVVDQNDQHLYQPGLLFIPFGIYTADEVCRPRGNFLHKGVTYVQSGIERIAADENEVHLTDGQALAYDVLIVATGCALSFEETEGLTGPGWREIIFDFYTLEGAVALAEKLKTWPGGRLVIDIVDMPIKCPVAPLEFAFLADWFFTERGIRDEVNITYVTPLDGAFTKPVASQALGKMLEDRHIEIVPEFNAGQVDGEAGRLLSWDERTVDFDLLVTIPLHTGEAFLARTPQLADDLNFVLTDPATLQAKFHENIFALGDATNLPASKAGSVVHFQSEILEENIERYLNAKPLTAQFDGHSNCFIETGYHKAMLIDFNYEVEPLPGKFPLPVVGPMKLLEENRANHWGKLLFRWVYWNWLLPGRNMPGIGPAMSMRGKRVPETAATTNTDH